MNELFSSSAVTADAPSETALCEQCGKPFEPRSGSGGKPQRFCSPECRAASHNKPQRAQRSPTCSNVGQLPVVIQPIEKDAPADAPDDFDWAGEDVVIHEQPATAVYFNRQGGLVIRQRATGYGDDDPFVVISPENIDAFIDKLTDIVGIPSFGGRKR